MPLGKGQVTIFGALLPQADRGAGPGERHPHRDAAPVRAGRLRRHDHRRPGARQRPGATAGPRSPCRLPGRRPRPGSSLLVPAPRPVVSAPALAAGAGSPLRALRPWSPLWSLLLGAALLQLPGDAGAPPGVVQGTSVAEAGPSLQSRRPRSSRPSRRRSPSPWRCRRAPAHGARGRPAGSRSPTGRVPGTVADVLGHFRTALPDAGLFVGRDEDERRGGRADLPRRQQRGPADGGAPVLPAGRAQFTVSAPRHPLATGAPASRRDRRAGTGVPSDEQDEDRTSTSSPGDRPVPHPTSAPSRRRPARRRRCCSPWRWPPPGPTPPDRTPPTFAVYTAPGQTRPRRR